MNRNELKQCNCQSELIKKYAWAIQALRDIRQVGKCNDTEKQLAIKRYKVATEALKKCGEL